MVCVCWPGEISPARPRRSVRDAATSEYVVGTTAWTDCARNPRRREGPTWRSVAPPERIFLNGEEATEGAWARIVTGDGAGEAWQLPRMGRMATENAVPNPRARDHTTIVASEDGNLNTAPVASNFSSELYFYIGMKQ